MFKDVKAKINFYKEKIIKDYIDKGIYPSTIEIKNELSLFDPYLSVFKSKKNKKGDKINTKDLNEQYKSISEDLHIIYKILYDITIKELLETESYANSHIDELERLVTTYKRRAEIEINSTSLGETIFFQDNSFNIINNLTTTRIELGQIGFRERSKISFHVNMNNIDGYKIACFIEDGTKQLVCNPYNINQESLFINGELDKETYEFNIDKNQSITFPYEVNIGKKINQNTYFIFAGQNKLLMTDLNDTSGKRFNVIEKETIEAKGSGMIEFYVVGGNSIEFTFNKSPISASFNKEERIINNLKEHHYFKIEYDDGFVFDFNIDTGKVYAVKDKGLINNSKLYFSKNIDLRDFLVEEYTIKEPKLHNVYLEIYNSEDEHMNIENIMIKQLFYMEEL